MILSDVVDEARRVTDSAGEQGVTLRVLGGVAISLHAEAGIHPCLARTYRDLDLVSTRKDGRASAALLQSLGYSPNERFNAMNGSTRMVFYDEQHQRQVDVFVGEFRMCHEIPIANRLELEKQTVPLAELLLTKLQIVELNDKDLVDVWALVLEHDVAEHDDDAVNGGEVARILAGDWGLWRTSRGSIETTRARLAGSPLTDGERAVIDERLDRLWERIESEPKGLRWRSRAKVGDRSKWYDEPEEIAHGEPRAITDG